jgi:hypothetical protein
MHPKIPTGHHSSQSLVRIYLTTMQSCAAAQVGFSTMLGVSTLAAGAKAG